MKKSLSLLALVFAVSGTYAQDLTSKKGEPILPEAGDYGLGIDATPFLDYAGNFFGKTTSNTAPTFNFLSGLNTITGRYFIDAKTALRGSINLGFGGPKTTVMVNDRSKTAPDPAANGYPNQTPAQVENSWKQSTTTIGLSGGAEMRRGKTRLQGYTGAELGIFFINSKSKFEYGNALAVNQTPTGFSQPQDVTPTSADGFAGAGNVADAAALGIPGANGGVNNARASEIKNGTLFSVGLRAFIGVEYFLFPKISLGGEFGWGLGLTTQGASKTTWETTGNPNSGAPAGTDTVSNTEIKGGKQSQFLLSTDNDNGIWGPAGTLRLNFYF